MIPNRVEPLSASKVKRQVYLGAFGLALLAAGTALLFFLIGLSDGTVSAFNAVPWLVLLAVVCGIPWAGHVFWSHGKAMQAIGVLAVAAVPMLLAGVVVVILIVAPPRWN